MPESSELIFEISQDTVLRLAREYFAKMTEDEQNAVIGVDADPDDESFAGQARQVLEHGVDPRTLKDFDDYGFFETVEGILEPLNKQLAEIHKRLIERRFGKTYKGDIGADKPKERSLPRGVVDANNWYTYTCAVTPAGRRAFSLFSISRFADEDSYDDPTWGIGLTSRYIPAWIDWRERHGGSGEFRLNAEALEMIEEARTAMAEVLPEIKDADLVNAPNFY